MHAQATSVEPHADYSHLLARRHGTTRAILDIGDEWELPANELDDPDDEPPELRAGHDLEHEIAESSADRESCLLAHAARVRTELFGPAGVTSDTRGDQRGIPRPVGDLATGLVYPSTSEAAEFVGLRSHHVKNAIDRAGDAAGRRWAWADESHVNEINFPPETLKWILSMGMMPGPVQFGKSDGGVVGLNPLAAVDDGAPPLATCPHGTSGGARPCHTGIAFMPRRRTAPQSGVQATPPTVFPTPGPTGNGAVTPPVADDLNLASQVIDGLVGKLDAMEVHNAELKAKVDTLDGRNEKLKEKIATLESQNIEMARSIIQLSRSPAVRDRWTQLLGSLNARRQVLATAVQPVAHAAPPTNPPALPVKRGKKRKRQVARLPRQDTGAIAGPGAVQQQVPQAQPELAAVA